MNLLINGANIWIDIVKLDIVEAFLSLDYALKLNGILITGDELLRKKVRFSGVEVRGIIFIIEEIKIQEKLPCNQCIQKLEELKSINDRLPVQEIDKRILDWIHSHP